MGLNIGTFNNEQGAVFNNNSLNAQPAANNPKTADVYIQDSENDCNIAISDDGAQVDLLRIAVAADRIGLFKKKDGSKLS